MVCCGKLLLTVLQQALQALDPLVPSDELPLCNSNFLLQAAILLDELSLHDSQLLQIPLQERHLLLLCSVVRRSQYVIVLFTRLVKRDF